MQTLQVEVKTMKKIFYPMQIEIYHYDVEDVITSSADEGPVVGASVDD